MKLFVLAVFLPLLAVALSQGPSCGSDFTEWCKRDDDVTKNTTHPITEPEKSCTAMFGGFKEITGQMVTSVESLVNDHLTTSMEYLLLANKYAQWDHNRPELHSFFNKHSDNAWDDAVALVQHMVQRGKTPKISVNIPTLTETDILASEIENLSWALQKEQTLVQTTIDVIGHAHKESHDPELRHFLSEQVSDKQVMRIKTLANHVNTLYSVMFESNNQDKAATNNQGRGKKNVDHLLAMDWYIRHMIK
jgi:ferritin